MIAKPKLGAPTLIVASILGGGLLSASCHAGGSSGPIPIEARAERLATLPDGRHLNFRCSGEGRPTVILESGFAATSLAWYKVRPALAKRFRVCAYDRAGYGFSDPGPMPRDGAAIALDLDQGLKAAGIDGPFIVVGHSAGGLYARLFADRRAKDVVGMVLSDPSIEYQDRRLAALFGPGAGSLSPLIARAERCLAAARAGALPSDSADLKVCTPTATGAPAVQAARLTEALRPSTWETQISELETLWTLTSDEVAGGRARYGNLPMIVLTADGTYAGAPATWRPTLDAFWSGAHREVASRSDLGQERTVTGSSHMMMMDRPDSIVAAVNEVADEAVRPRRSHNPQ